MSCDSANFRSAPEFRLSSLSANGSFKKPAVLLAAAALLASPVVSAQEKTEKVLLAKAAAEAEQQLKQTFTNLQFDDFEPAPVKGAIYQASAGGRIVYYAPESEHLLRSEEHTSELQSLMRISYAVFCLKKKKQKNEDCKRDYQQN